MSRAPRFAPGVGLLLAALLAAAVPPLLAQDAASLRMVGPDGDTRLVDLERHRGYAALPASALAPLGWSLSRPSGGPSAEGAWELRHPTGTVLSFRAGTPFFRWDGRLLQLVSEPYEMGRGLHVPAQVVTDFLPARLPDAYAWERSGGASILRVTSAAHWVGDGTGAPGPTGVPEPPRRRTEDEARVVVIDAGHGGRDPGSLGPTGLQEKEVALGIALALAEELSAYPGIEVHLTRDSDTLVPIWRRGEWATEVKGDRHGIFVSIHTNGLEQRSIRGFETYFLADARTEHERRVAALENAPVALEGREEEAGGDLGFILKELRNLDHSHWSALLAELVQDRVAPIHPGPNRGVKQAPLAVITNALMPAVLVETGFITNRAEERLLADAAFQEDMARALAGAVVDFFQRYPPGVGTDLEGAGGERR